MESSNHHRSRIVRATYLLAAAAAILFAVTGSMPSRAAFATIHNFFGTPVDGAQPFGTVVEDPATGDVYGTTATGGTHGLGVVYCMNPNFGLTIIHNFAGIDGAYPTCTLILGPSPIASTAILYGTTLRGGKFNEGVVFKLTVTGAGYARLHNFGATATDGMNPWAGVILASDGRLHGTTFLGGTYGQGTTYRISTTGGGYFVTHNFVGLVLAGVPPDGAHPIARLFECQPGVLVGTTFAGGQTDDGTVFTENLGGAAHTIIHSFANIPDGAHPTSELISLVSPSGGIVLWGTTRDGGASVDGTVYSLTPTGGAYTDEYDFHGGPDGANPYGALVFDSKTGNLYGSTQNGGPSGNGVVYEALPVGPAPIPEAVLHPLALGEGEHPLSALYLDLAGTELYGTTRDGGFSFNGTIFIQTP